MTATRKLSERESYVRLLTGRANVAPEIFVLFVKNVIVLLHYLSRMYVHSGYIWHMGLASEVLERPSEYAEYVFMNKVNHDFKEMISKSISFERLVNDHTLVKYYIRFLPKEKRKLAYEHAVKNEVDLYKFLSMPKDKKDYYLSYCPKCVEEDRKKYGESFYHIYHSIPGIHICGMHGCELINTKVKINKCYDSTFVPLEILVNSLERKEYGPSDINVRFTRYVYEVINQPIDFDNDILIGDYLLSKLSDKYMSSRGERKNLSLIEEDMKLFYKDLNNYEITKSRIASVFRNISYNVLDIFLVAFFEEVSVEDLVSCKDYKESRYLEFDNEVRRLHSEGYSNNKIAKIMNSDKEVVRQILLGNYDKVSNKKSKDKCQKWNWSKIDEECCNQFDEKIKDYKGAPITKSLVADVFGLKDKSLRNLPKLRKKMCETKRNQAL